MNIDRSIFKDYDIRGTYPNQVNKEVMSAIAYAIIRKFQPKSVALCRDMRLSGKEIENALTDVFIRQGINVALAGLVGTEMQYYIAGTKDYDLVIMISASHNPPEYNGIKLVLKGPIAVSGESGMYDVRDLVNEPPLPDASTKGTVTTIDIWNEWKDKIYSIVNPKTIKPMNAVIDAGNGMGGILSEKILANSPITIIPLFMEPDGHFPNHVPNPLVEENTKVLSQKILETHADIGITFDGDADRMFLLDNQGRFVSGTITTALLARYILHTHPGETILYNAICGRIVPQTIEKFGGKSIRVRVGHSPIKIKMKEIGSIFAGEHSGHYYHRDYFCAESGILTALMVMALLTKETKKLSELVDELDVYPASGEINFIMSDIPSSVLAIQNGFPDAESIDQLDGVSVWYKDYWFNVRASKTEPLLRLNVEADTKKLLETKTKELVNKIESLGGIRK